MNKYTDISSSSKYVQDIKLYLKPNPSYPHFAEPNSKGIKACVVYRKWLEYVLIKITPEMKDIQIQDLEPEVTYILSKQLLKLLQPEYILSELINKQMELQKL